MQDRFKFRAWDTEEGRYASDEDICFDTGGACDSVYDLLKHDDQFYVYEQSTGLKDKNGKLIYEGDIVRYKLFHEDYLVGTYLNKVTFNHGSFTPICNRNVGDVEVIGNIHKNPKLLEE